MVSSRALARAIPFATQAIIRPTIDRTAVLAHVALKQYMFGGAAASVRALKFLIRCYLRCLYGVGIIKHLPGAYNLVSDKPSFPVVHNGQVLYIPGWATFEPPTPRISPCTVPLSGHLSDGPFYFPYRSQNAFYAWIHFLRGEFQSAYDYVRPYATGAFALLETVASTSLRISRQIYQGATLRNCAITTAAFVGICLVAELTRRQIYKRSVRKAPIVFTPPSQYVTPVPPVIPLAFAAPEGAEDEQPQAPRAIEGDALLAHHRDNYPHQLLDSITSCVPCLAGVCDDHLGPVIIHPGVNINGPRCLAFLASRSNLIMLPSPAISTATYTVTPQGPSFLPFQSRLTTRGPITCHHLGTKHQFDFYTVRFAEVPVVCDANPNMFVVNGKHIVVNRRNATMVETGETIPLAILSTIAARMATSTAEPEKLYDQVGSHLRSKLTARNIRVSYFVEWQLFLIDYTNRASVSAGPSVRDNARFNPTMYHQLRYNFFYYARRLNPFSSVPSREEYTFPDIPVPTYEVFTPRVNADCNEEFRPEGPMPFPVVRAADDPPIIGEPVGDPRADNEQRPVVDGAPRADRAADPQPPPYRADEQPRVLDVDNVPPVQQHMPDPPDLPPAYDGTRGRYVLAVPDCTRARTLTSPTQGDRPFAAIIGDATLSCVPRLVERDDGEAVWGWSLILEGELDWQRYPAPLHLCWTCARHYARMAVTERRSAYGVLARAQGIGNLDYCRVNQEELPPW